VHDVTTDTEIMVRIQGGDADALRVLYDRYGRLAFAIAYRMLGEAGAAEDVVQDAFLTVWNRGTTFKVGPEANVRGWLLAIVRNRTIDQARRTSRPETRTVPVEDVESRLATPDAWAEVESRAVAEAVRTALADLPEEQRRVIDLAYFEGLSQSTIATRLDVPLGTVKGRFRMGFRKLATSLAAQRPGAEIDQDWQT